MSNDEYKSMVLERLRLAKLANPDGIKTVIINPSNITLTPEEQALIDTVQDITHNVCKDLAYL